MAMASSDYHLECPDCDWEYTATNVLEATVAAFGHYWNCDEDDG